MFFWYFFKKKLNVMRINYYDIMYIYFVNVKIKVIVFPRTNVVSKTRLFYGEKEGFLVIVWLFVTKVIIQYNLPFVIQA